jgi:hypothetical protein
MADVIKKVRIPKKDLPALVELTPTTSGYKVMFRIVSDDTNLVSHWSRIYDITVTGDTYEDVVNSIEVTQDAISLYWITSSSLLNKTYDVFVKWSNTSWEYADTVTNNFYSLLKKDGATNVQFTVQYATSEKTLDPISIQHPNGQKGLVVFRSEISEVVGVGIDLIDGGSVV